MEDNKYPRGDVYEFGLDASEPLRLPRGTSSFKVGVTVRNISKEPWDTTDGLRVAAMLIPPEDKDEQYPTCFVEKRVAFAKRRFLPLEEFRFVLDINVNLLPAGAYILALDLVVEMKYFLSFTGGRRFHRAVVIASDGAANLDPSLLLTSRMRAPSGEWALDPRDRGVRQPFHLSAPDRTASTAVIVKINWGTYFIRHYVHFIEFIICFHAIYLEYIGEGEIVLCIGRQPFTYGNNPDVQRFVLNSLFADWRVDFSEDKGATPCNGGYVVDFDGFRMSGQMNRLILEYFDLVEHWFETFKAHCLGRMTDPPLWSNRRVAVYAKRSVSRAFEARVEQELAALFQSFGFEVVEVDFGLLPIEEQVNVARSAGAIYGPHGNNLTNCLWLQKGTIAVEVFPAGFHSFDFQVFSELAGVRYLGIEAREHGFVHRDGTRVADWKRLDAPYHTHQFHQDDISFIQKDVIASFLRRYA